MLENLRSLSGREENSETEKRFSIFTDIYPGNRKRTENNTQRNPEPCFYRKVGTSCSQKKKKTKHKMKEILNDQENYFPHLQVQQLCRGVGRAGTSPPRYFGAGMGVPGNCLEVV